MPYLTELKALAERLGVIHPDEVQGCTEAEIQALEDTLQIKLPEAYREFLAWMGKGSGVASWDKGFPNNANDLLLIQQEAQDLRYYYPLQLPTHTFVFLMHQSSVFYFFLLTEGNNPAIYTENDDGNEFRKNYCSFTEFLEHTILNAHIVANNSLHENYLWLNEQYIPCNNKSRPGEASVFPHPRPFTRY